MCALPSATNETTVFIRSEYAFCCRPLWSFVLSSLYAAFLAGKTGQASIATITWDASHHVFVGTLPDSDDMHLQASSAPRWGPLP